MNIEISDKIGQYSDEVLYLQKAFSDFNFDIKIPVIEIVESSRTGKTETEIENIKKENPHYDPDNSSGEYYKGVIRLFKNAFDQNMPYELRMKRALGVLIHEISHLVFDGLSELEKKLWKEARKQDGLNNHVSKYTKHVEEVSGQNSVSDDSEDFCESFRLFILESSFKNDFPNRAKFFERQKSY